MNNILIIGGEIGKTAFAKAMLNDENQIVNEQPIENEDVNKLLGQIEETYKLRKEIEFPSFDYIPPFKPEKHNPHKKH